MQAVVPLAIQIVIDDVGWWNGTNGSAYGEPFRTGSPRPHVLADYEAIIELGRRLGMRPQAAMILCEWDRDHALRRLPTSTWQGVNWDNSRWQGPWLDEASDYLAQHREHLELVLHGVGHEYWEGPRFTRAEWHDHRGRMRPVKEVEAHLEAFAALLARNRLGPFPESFVPCSFLHGFGSPLAGLLAARGVKYISTPFRTMARVRPTEDECFGLEAGLLTVDRGRDLVPWFGIAPEPVGALEGTICGMHWPNLLHPDPARNLEVVDRWVNLLQGYHQCFDRLLAPDTASSFSQVVYHRWTGVSANAEGLVLDFTWVAAAAANTPGILDHFFLKVKAGADARFEAMGMTLITALWENGHWCLHLRRQTAGLRGTLRLVG
jgi:hypothetical protein